MARRMSVLIFAAALLAGCGGDAVEPFGAAQAAKEGSSTLRLVTTKSTSNNAVSALIDRQGGLVTDEANGHQLEVPRGAVSEPTYFVMGTAASDKYVVKLVAYRASDLSPVTQFTTKPLKLRINFAGANVPDPRRLRIVYVSNDLSEILEVLSTSISRGSKAEASITHFSIYSMAID